MVTPMANTYEDEALLWQTQTGMRFRQLGSYGGLLP